ncbi:MAG TPA: N-acetyl-gamma-glutamyl-phosphate reductase [Candidatus Limiplasma sp.]|nr:N-acetyl-gamma-glutamyl-phosphate reductase [Candidatus Limiplasma sp.]HPR77277.1 N-acetyl-gamma-glutamyl-phosphate reductase [Candidatus Limiplasma sp.]
MTKVFISGGSGTTGLRIVERLSARADIELVSLPEELRKDPAAQAELAEQADITFLCLPDDASRALIAALGDTKGRVLDTSTAFRTDARFAYGFPELSPAHEAAVKQANRVAVPGCHASGAIALLYPLVQAGAISPDAELMLTSLTGYSGGGKKMIAEYETPGRDGALRSLRSYAVTQHHKHLPEIVHVCGLAETPIFQPVLGDYYAGMLVSLPLRPNRLRKPLTLGGLTELYRAHYAGQPLIRVRDANPEAYLAANAMAGSDGMELFATGTDERAMVCARFDNLGKGASGAAIQCMNLMLGLSAQTGLNGSFT